MSHISPTQCQVVSQLFKSKRFQNPKYLSPRSVTVAWHSWSAPSWSDPARSRRACRWSYHQSAPHMAGAETRHKTASRSWRCTSSCTHRKIRRYGSQTHTRDSLSTGKSYKDTLLYRQITNRLSRGYARLDRHSRPGTDSWTLAESPRIRRAESGLYTVRVCLLVMGK